MKAGLLLALGLTGVLSAAAAGADAPAKPAQTEHEFTTKVTVTDRKTGEKSEKTVTTKYLLFLPAGCPAEKTEGAKRWPTILFLHGAGERGDDLARVKVHGPPKIVETKRDFSFIVVSPQCPSGTWWRTDVMSALLDEIEAKYSVDADRLYVTGLSMGGFGTWDLGAKTPQRFAALAPICGGGRVETAPKLVNIPIWAFHGGKDNIVPMRKSEEMVKAIEAAGGTKAKLTVYPEAGHDSWTKTYDDPELYKWFLSHTRPKPAAAK